MSVIQTSNSVQKLIEPTAPSASKDKTSAKFSNLPPELQVHIAAYISLKDANQSGNRALIESAFESRFYEIKKKPSIYYACLEALEKTQPGGTQVKMTRHCLAKVNMELYENSTYLSQEQFSSLKIDSAQQLLGLSLQKRILAGQMILEAKDNALIDLFNRLTHSLSLIGERSVLVQEMSLLSSPAEIRKWIGDIRNISQLPETTLNLRKLGNLPPEVSQIFHKLSPHIRSKIIHLICQRGEIAPFKSLLMLNPSPVVAGMPLPNGLFTDCVLNKRFDFAKEAMEHVEFSTLPCVLIVPNEELGEPTDWYQILVEETAKRNIDAFEFLLNLPNSDRLNLVSIFDACLQSDHDEALEILSQSRLRHQFQAEQIANSIIDKCDRLTENKFSSIFQFPKAKEIPLELLEDLLHSLICRHLIFFACSSTTGMVASMRKLLEKFPALRPNFNITIQDQLKIAEAMGDLHATISLRSLSTIL